MDQNNIMGFYYNNPEMFKDGMHNLYLFQSIDRDGNVVEEKYGTNVLTDLGFQHYYSIRNSYETSVYCFLGDGDGEPSTSDTTLFHQTITTVGTWNNDKRYECPMLYNKDTGIITGMLFYGRFWWDYNLTGIETDVPITEIVITTQNKTPVVDALVHTKVFDMAGNPSTITKKPNQKLYISIFWVANVHEDIINKKYSEQQFLMLDPRCFIAYQYNKHDTNNTALNYYQSRKEVYNLMRFRNKGNVYSLYNTTEQSDVRKMSFTADSEIFTEKRDFIDMTIASMRNVARNYDYSYSGINYHHWVCDDIPFIMFRMDKMKTPETLESDCVYTNSFASPYLTNTFGLNFDTNSRQGELPVTDFKITDLKMYNRITHGWDVEVSYVDGEGVEFANSFIAYMTFNMYFEGADRELRVWANSDTSVGIVGFNDPGMIMYATDKYWDTDTYVKINNLSDIEPELRNKRFYVTTTKTVSVSNGPNNDKWRHLHPKRDYPNEHRIVIPETIMTDKAYDISAYWIRAKDDARDLITNDEKGYVDLISKIVYPFANGGCVDFDVPDYNSQPQYSDHFYTNNGNTLIVRTHTTHQVNYRWDHIKTFRIYDLTNCPTEAPTMVEIILNTTVTGPSLYVSTSDDGWVIVNNVANWETVVINVNDRDSGTNKPSQTVYTNMKYCTAVYNMPHQIIYMDNTYNGSRIVVKDLVTEEELHELILPSANNYSVNGIHGWKNKAIITAVSNGINYLIIYDFTTGNLTATPDITLAGNYISVHQQLARIYACDEFIIIGGGTTSTYGEDSINYPTIMIDNNKHSDNPYVFGTYATGIRSLQVKSVNEGKHLLMIAFLKSGVRSVIDLGMIINEDGEDTTKQGANRLSSFSNTRTGMLIRDYMFYIPSNTEPARLIPYHTLMRYKIKGDTYTIQTYNNPKRIYGKNINISITNNPSKIDTSPVK